MLGFNAGSVLHAQLIRQWSDDVAYFAHTQEPAPTEAVELAARGIRIVHGEVARLVVADDRLTGVELVDGQVIARTAGFPVTDGTGRTSVPGVWGAGNAIDPRAQVITAAGQGSAAAIASNNDLTQDDIALAVGAGPPDGGASGPGGEGVINARRAQR